MKNIFTIIVFFTILTKFYAQDAPKTSKMEAMEFRAYLMPGFGNLVTKNRVGDQMKTMLFNTNKGKFAYNWGVSGVYYYPIQKFTQIKLGYGFGLEHALYKSDLELLSYKSTFRAMDDTSIAPQDSLMRTVTTGNVKENVKIHYINIPITLCNFVYLIPGDRWRIFMDLGIKLGFSTKSIYTGIGSFTSEGYYDVYNVKVDSLPEFGFYPNKSFDAKEQKLNTKTLNITGFVSLGTSYAINSKIKLHAAFFYERGLRNISDYNAQQFQLAKYDHDYTSLIAPSKRIVNQGFGLQLGMIADMTSVVNVLKKVFKIRIVFVK